MNISKYLASLIIVIVTAVVVLPATSFTAKAENPETIAENLQTRYAAIDSMSFFFSQKTSGQMSGRPKTGKGNGIYARTKEKPLMRWNYLTPDPQVVISDGTTISMYFEKLNQMIISGVDKAQADILFSFFTADEPLDHLFLILPPFLAMDLSTQTATQTATNMQILQLQPLDKNSQIKNIHLWISNDSIIRRIELLDHFDTRTTINLSNIEVNPLDVSDQQDLDKRFSFTPPEGTEIIKQ